VTSSDTILIEPNRLFRQGLKYLLSDTGFDVSAEFNTVDLALGSGTTSTTVDLVISSQSVKDEAELRALREAFPTARLMVLADNLSVDVLRAAIDGGADGFLVKNISPEVLIQSLQLVMLGEKVFPADVASMLIDMNGTEPQRSVCSLSPCEQEILGALVTGTTNRVIAIRLGITEAAVKAHMKTLLRRIGVNNRTMAAIWAVNNGFNADGVLLSNRRFHAVFG
jgi:two-component system nitrate/nitrite response regulator NarL